MSKANTVQVVLVTCGTILEGRKIARNVVKKRLAACVTILLGPVQSIYRWKGNVESASEHLLLMKTTKKQIGALEKEVKRLHSYDVPEFIALPVEASSREYLAWLTDATNPL